MPVHPISRVVVSLPAASEQPDVRQHLVAREAAARAGLVLELGVQELGHQIVGGVLGAPVDVFREIALEGCPADGAGQILGVGHLARCEAQTLVDAVAERLLVLFGDAEQHADRAHRHLGAEILDEVEAAGADERIQALRAEPPHLRLEGVDLAGREQARQQGAVDPMTGRVLEDDHARRHLHVRLDQLEDRSAAGDEGLPVDQAPLDVVEPAQRDESVALVGVERPLVAKPLPDRVRIGVDLEVVGVVVHVRV